MADIKSQSQVQITQLWALTQCLGQAGLQAKIWMVSSSSMLALKIVNDLSSMSRMSRTFTFFIHPQLTVTSSSSVTSLQGRTVLTSGSDGSWMNWWWNITTPYNKKKINTPRMCIFLTDPDLTIKSIHLQTAPLWRLSITDNWYCLNW